MRLLYFGNNRLGWNVLEHLCAQQDDEIAGLVIHPPGKQSFVERMLDTVDLPSDRIFDGSRLEAPETLARIHALACDTGVSVQFDYVLRPALLDSFAQGVINLHTSYLPYNRGQYPNVWSIVEETPAGVTLHYMDRGIDTGDIVAQRQVTIDPVDTGESLHRKLERAGLELFRDTWPAIRSGRVTRTPQNGTGTSHRTRDVDRIDRIELDGTYTGRELLNILRARTFPPHRGAYIEVEGRRIYLRLTLEEEAERQGACQESVSSTA